MNNKGNVGSEIWGDFMKMILILVLIYGAVFMFQIWGQFGIWPFIIIIVLIGGAFLLYKGYAGGYINL